jgi:hypothetical protein
MTSDHRRCGLWRDTLRLLLKGSRRQAAHGHALTRGRDNASGLLIAGRGFDVNPSVFVSTDNRRDPNPAMWLWPIAPKTPPFTCILFSLLVWQVP